MSIGAVGNSVSRPDPYASKVEEDQNKPINAADKAKEAEKAEQSKSSALHRDEYIPSDGKAEKTPGLYRLEADENGDKRIVFDRPDSTEQSKPADGTQGKEQAGKSPETVSGPDIDALLPEKGDGPEKPGDKKGGLFCRVDTDKVDSEIKKLKEQKQQIQQQLNSVRDDEEKRRDLEQRLSQIESELSAKENDGYRKANASYTYSSTPI
ncbi:MAG: hypothetical protein VB078_03180 [Clostridiaceae bacterium]|nr:hypothetical protein [Clostridiaceae bacterium]